MDKRAALYKQFDPARPLEADSNLYVDWQRDLADALDRDDLKPRLANSISLSGDEPVTRLLTGHRGVGKTTELKRIKRILEGHQGAAFTIGRKYFVSLLAAEQWLDLEDVGRLGEANCIKSLGDVALRQGRHQQAEASYKQALPIFRQIGDRLGEANTLLSMGRLARAIGNVEQMRSSFQQAEMIFKSIGLDQWAQIARQEAASHTEPRV